MAAEDQLYAFLDKLARPEVITAVLDRGAEAIKTQAERTWPSKLHRENVFATDLSVEAWVIERPSLRERVIKCDVEYSGYTDQGFTRKGKATAFPFKERGGEVYTAQIVKFVIGDIAQDLVRSLTDG